MSAPPSFHRPLDLAPIVQIAPWPGFAGALKLVALGSCLAAFPCGLALPSREAAAAQACTYMCRARLEVELCTCTCSFPCATSCTAVPRPLPPAHTSTTRGAETSSWNDHVTQAGCCQHCTSLFSCSCGPPAACCCSVQCRVVSTRSPHRQAQQLVLPGHAPGTSHSRSVHHTSPQSRCQAPRVTPHTLRSTFHRTVAGPSSCVHALTGRQRMAAGWHSTAVPPAPCTSCASKPAQLEEGPAASCLSCQGTLVRSTRWHGTIHQQLQQRMPNPPPPS